MCAFYHISSKGFTIRTLSYREKGKCMGNLTQTRIHTHSIVSSRLPEDTVCQDRISHDPLCLPVEHVSPCADQLQTDV